MKYALKISPIIICSLSICLFFSPVSQADYQLKPSTVQDITYVVYIWNNQSTLFNPRWIDQFEFDAGDVFSVYTTRRGELTGKWIESQLAGNLTWFQAWVEKEDTSTTTTTPGTTTTTTPQLQFTRNIRLNQLNENQLKFDINIWGISYTFIPPEPFNTIELSTIFGYGAYLGSDAFFIGFASVPIDGEFGSINPSSAEQGDTGVLVEITGKNTNFQTGKTDVSFGQGISVVGTVDVDSTEKLSVEIDIDDEATIGKRTVTVTYETGVVTGKDVFEVLRKSD